MTNMTNVNVLVGPPRCGKTAELRSEMLTRPDRYLFAMPRNDLFEERVRDLRANAFALGVNPVSSWASITCRTRDGVSFGGRPNWTCL
jgi:hypothetical protein